MTRSSSLQSSELCCNAVLRVSEAFFWIKTRIMAVVVDVAQRGFFCTWIALLYWCILNNCGKTLANPSTVHRDTNKMVWW